MNEDIRQLLAKHGYELIRQLSKDGRRELKAGLARDGQFFRFFPRDLKVMTDWVRKYGYETISAPPGTARKAWKEVTGSDREPEEYYGG